MPKLKLRFSATSHRDLKDIFNYLHPRNPQAANSVINAIEKSIALLVEHPYAARLTDMKDVRVRPIARYPFLIFYHADQTYLTIIRIWHSSREWPDELDG